MLIRKKQMMPIKMLYCLKFSAGDWAIGLQKKVISLVYEKVSRVGSFYQVESKQRLIV